jgi:hypothetical protein
VNLLLNDSAAPERCRAQKPSVKRTRHEGAKMDEYQEELLEYQAYEMDPLEPAEDATEL